MKGYTCILDIQHLTLPKRCINEQGNKKNLNPIPQENNIFIPVWINQHLSHNQKYIQIVYLSIVININIA